MHGTDRPRAPAPIRMALLLVYAMILTRLWLMQSELAERFAGVQQSIQNQENSTNAFALLAEFDRGTTPLVPGSLGNPLLFLLIIPLLIITRRLMRKGYGTAATVFLVFLALRSTLILLRGPWTAGALLLLALMIAIGALLLLPRSQQWFRASARWRAGEVSPPATALK